MRFCIASLFMFLALAHAAVAGEPLSVTIGSDGVTVRAGGAPFASYLFRSGTRPVLWPIVGPTGGEMTRGYPLTVPGASEHDDHIHHRSMWIGYEGVNGVDFWHEPETGRGRSLPIGTVRHRELVRADSNGQVATVGTRNDWLDPEGDVVCHDQRLFEFRVGKDWRAIDCVLDMWSSDGPLRFGDSKEGFFAVRVAGTMKVDAGLGGKITNSLGDRDAQAWGKRAAWTDYAGPVDGQPAGICLFSHPANRAAPTDGPSEPCWHVRPYGLFGANPFGAATFGEQAKGNLTVKEGERLRFRYRVLLHTGDWDAERLAQAYDDYAKRWSDN